MDFLDEDTRPRFLFQSKTNNVPNPNIQFSNQLNKPFLFLTCSLSLLLICISIFYIETEPFKSLLVWLSLSLLLGPFAPSSRTGGDIRVGEGPTVQFPIEQQQPPADEEQQFRKKASQNRSRSKLYEDYGNGSAGISNGYVKIEERSDLDGKRNDGSVKANQEEEKEWSEEDVEVLRKQMLKHPAGKPRRWEIIADVFNGRHKVDSVIQKAKDLGNKKSSDKDSYAQFLKNRKPADKRVEFETSNENGDSKGGGEGVREEIHWSNGEDIALLNALKAFPKDVSMRWEKITAAVPGKTKAACMKRVAELKKDFRSSKASREE